jgi:tRNA pseudouridine38-40 synthase
VLKDPLPAADVVSCSLMLHHLGDEGAVHLLRAMRAAARRLVGTHDFRAFGRSPRAEGHTVRRIHELPVEAAGRDQEWVTITVVADAFLYGMVRRIAGALVAVGLGRRPPEWIDDLLRATVPGPEPAPPQGLTQLRVDY